MEALNMSAQFTGCDRDLSQSLSIENDFAPSLLNESDEISEKKVKEIRDWIMSDEKLNAHTDDFTISRFLRCCKFNLEKTKRRMYNFYAQRTESPEWFSNRNPFLPELQEIFDLGYFLPLKKFDAEGRMIILLRPCIHDPRKHKLTHIIKSGNMIFDIATKIDVLPLHGVIVIMDMTGVTLSHALQLTPNIVQRLVHSWQECYPLKIQSFNVVNAPIYIYIVINLFKRFMKSKLRERMSIHSGTIADFFVANCPLSCHLLPIEFGGESGTLQDLKDHWKKEAQNNYEWFKEDEKYRLH